MKDLIWPIVAALAAHPLRVAALLLAGLLALAFPEAVPLLVRLCVSSSSNLPLPEWLAP